MPLFLLLVPVQLNYNYLNYLLEELSNNIYSSFLTAAAFGFDASASAAFLASSKSILSCNLPVDLIQSFTVASLPAAAHSS